jgi:5-methyltetrahydropteroyltriglutamate--homocysteine methyltransferase
MASEDLKTPCFDDIGSFPLPRGMRAENIALDDSFLETVQDALAQTMAAGVETPTYPQFRDMIKMFMDPNEDPERSESPYLIKREEAQIFELKALESMGKKMAAEGKRLGARVCVTGPVELYLARFGATDYTDLLGNLAESVARFFEEAVNFEAFDVVVACIDEPSLGISPNVIFQEEDLIEAMDIATRPCKNIDCEVHLHSPLMAELSCQVPGINVVGVESAANPDYLKLIDKKVLEEHQTFLRVGIARTDIDRMVAQLNDKLGENLWTDPQRLKEEVLKMESPDLMEKRLVYAHKLFGDLIRYAGPDCGLGSWPSQQMARQHLANCAKAIRSFRAGLE